MIEMLDSLQGGGIDSASRGHAKLCLANGEAHESFVPCMISIYIGMFAMLHIFVHH